MKYKTHSANWLSKRSLKALISVQIRNGSHSSKKKSLYWALYFSTVYTFYNFLLRSRRLYPSSDQFAFSFTNTISLIKK